MMLAMGYLGWPPATFFAATLPELLYAICGWQRARGIGVGVDYRNNAPAPALTQAELRDLIAAVSK